jgi:hypothetical protein
MWLRGVSPQGGRVHHIQRSHQSSSSSPHRVSIDGVNAPHLQSDPPIAAWFLENYAKRTLQPEQPDTDNGAMHSVGLMEDLQTAAPHGETVQICRAVRPVGFMQDMPSRAPRRLHARYAEPCARELHAR